VKKPMNCAEIIFTASFWGNTWKELGNSFLARHQHRYPQRWYDFYENQGSRMREIGGLDQEQGRSIAEILQQQGLLFPKCAVVDLGCGTGWLALPMALKETHVLAVDTSTGMLKTLKRQARGLNIKTLETQCSCWTKIKNREPFDLALAACFPPALCPDGISHMEHLGKKCALLLPNSEQGLPWVKNLWKALFKQYPFTGPQQLQVAFNYLMATGRTPGLLPVKTPLTVDLPIEQVIDFYTGYFSLFDKSGPAVRDVIQKKMEPFTHEGRVQARGEACFGLIWWGR